MTDAWLKELIAAATVEPDGDGSVRLVMHVVGLVRASEHSKLDHLLAIALDHKLTAVPALAVLRALWPVSEIELPSLPAYTAYVRAALVAVGEDPDTLDPPVR